MKENDKKELMAKKAFVLYPYQWPALKSLSVQQLGCLFQAIFETIRGEGDVNLKLDGAVKIAYGFLMNQIYIDHEKWEKKKKLNRERQKRFYNNNKNRNLTLSNVSPIKDSNSDSNSNSNSDSNSDSNSNSNSTTSFVGSVENSGKAAIGISDTANSKEEAAAGPKDLEFFERVFKPYVNNIIRDSNIPPIRKITPERYEKILKLREQYTSDDIYRVFQIAARSDFLNERGRKHKFQATFDWLIEPENFLRVLEGTYR